MPDITINQTGLNAVSEPHSTCQVTIGSAPGLSKPTVWYDLAHANGQNLWLSLREHAQAVSGNQTRKLRRAAEPSTRRQGRGNHKSDGSPA
jgi:hypothetical protein